VILRVVCGVKLAPAVFRINEGPRCGEGVLACLMRPARSGQHSGVPKGGLPREIFLHVLFGRGLRLQPGIEVDKSRYCLRGRKGFVEGLSRRAIRFRLFGCIERAARHECTL